MPVDGAPSDASAGLTGTGTGDLDFSDLNSEPMVKLGLVDLKSINGEDVEPTTKPTATDADPNADPDAQGTQEPTGPDWDSPDNPYRSDALEYRGKMGSADPDPRTTHQQRVAEVERVAAQEYQRLLDNDVKAGHITAEHAQIMVNLAKQAALEKLGRDLDRALLLPAARRETAERIAKQYSTKAVTLSADDLAKEPTVEAMQARAKAMVETRRNEKFSERKASGKDRAEGGAGMTTIDSKTLDGLSGAATIKLGLLRGQK